MQSVSTMKSHNFGEIEKDWKTTGEIPAYFEDQPSNNNCMSLLAREFPTIWQRPGVGIQSRVRRADLDRWTVGDRWLTCL